MKSFGKTLCLICFLQAYACMYAQAPVEKSSEKVKIGGQVYYLHIVKEKETLYSLGKAYEVTVEQITQANPELADGLKVGQTIKVPTTAAAPDSKKNNDKDKDKAKEKQPEAAAKPDAKKENAAQKPVYHIVKPGETLFSISQKYGTTPDALRKLNPDAFKNNELMSDVVLQVPTVASTFTGGTVKKAEPVRVQAGKIYHVVKPKETLWGIAQHYGTTPEELKRINPEAFKNGELMSGYVLQIASAVAEKPLAPAGDSTAAVASDTVPQTIPNTYFDISAGHDAVEPFAEPIKAALLLPLIPSGNAADYTQAPADSSLIDPTSGSRSRNVENFYAFYEGALLAIEDMKQQGLQLNLSVYDTYNLRKTEELVRKKTLEDEDIIIGPVYASNVKPVAQFAKENKIKIVSPLDPGAGTLTAGNPYFFQLSPPAYCRQKKLVDDVLKQENANIVLVHGGGAADSLLLETYKQLLGERAKEAKVLLHYVRRGTAVREELRRLLASSGTNCVLVASNNEAVVSDIAANLYLLTFKQRYSIILYGTERWRSFETIDLKYFHALSLRLVVPFFVDYEKENVKKFVARFQESFNADPSQYAFQGYDTFSYFLQAMMKYGQNFEQYLPKFQPALLQNDYKFKHDGSYNNGLVNVESCLINYTPAFTIVKL